MKALKKIRALKAAAANEQDTPLKWVVLLYALAEVVKIFTSDKTDAAIDELVRRVAAALSAGPVATAADVYAKLENENPQEKV